MKTMLLIGLIVFASQTAPAQTTVPVYLSFESRVLIEGERIPSLQKAEPFITELLAANCAAVFPYWTFVPVPSNQAPHLTIFLTRGSDDEQAEWNINMALRTTLGLRPWRGILMRPSVFTHQSSTLTTTSRWASLVARQFEEEIIDPHRDAIQTALQNHIPLGRKIVLNEPPPLSQDAREYVVLPLKSDTYRQLLGLSEIEIRCQSHLGGVVLYALATGLTADYTPKTRQFEGIAARLIDWEESGMRSPVTNHLHKITNLISGAFYLKTPKPYTDFDTFGEHQP
jgi:hypothetical protein